MNTNQILEEFSNLFSKWGLTEDDYCFAGEYALKYQGFPIEPRRSHFDFFVNKNKLPWKVEGGVESTTPPKDSREFKEFKLFLEKTNSDPHLLPIPLGDVTLENILERSTFIELNPTKRMRIIKPVEQIINYYNVLKWWDVKKRWTEEKIKRWLNYFDIFREYGIETNQEDIVKWSNKGIELVKEKNIQFEESESNLESDILNGFTAYPGYTRGKVRIVLNSDDLARVESGDIIIAEYAKPEYIIVANKISGMVADQGGTESHMAIMSRENKIPTVIGTKYATKILKDGDLVEVDANQGIVRKINKENQT